MEELTSSFTDAAAAGTEYPTPLYFKVVLKEARERSKLCDAVSAFLDDFAHTEEVLGKSFLRVTHIEVVSYLCSSRVTLRYL